MYITTAAKAIFKRPNIQTDLPAVLLLLLSINYLESIVSENLLDLGCARTWAMDFVDASETVSLSLSNWSVLMMILGYTIAFASRIIFINR